ncbi:MAG: ribosomal protein S18-alanine N-acetyltransferase [SAR86 cluster bacterium]|jgi:[ribosomal protein S18]-alanine N-acetyltransferase|nr:ribosomal protein S18-alanine N-acetyltransferase [SAR86 cluster bacterium]
MINKDKKEISYRYVTSEDLPFLIEVEESSNPHPWTKGNFEDCLERNHYCLLQLYNDKPTGFAIQSIALDEAHLLNIGISEEYRRIGLGGDLLDQILFASKAMGCLRIILEVRKSNIGAISLYESQGFKNLSLRKDYYKLGPKREDAIIMTKKLKKTWKNYLID